MSRVARLLSATESRVYTQDSLWDLWRLSSANDVIIVEDAEVRLLFN